MATGGWTGPKWSEAPVPLDWAQLGSGGRAGGMPFLGLAPLVLTTSWPPTWPLSGMEAISSEKTSEGVYFPRQGPCSVRTKTPEHPLRSPAAPIQGAGEAPALVYFGLGPGPG